MIHLKKPILFKIKKTFLIREFKHLLGYDLKWINFQNEYYVIITIPLSLQSKLDLHFSSCNSGHSPKQWNDVLMRTSFLYDCVEHIYSFYQ